MANGRNRQNGRGRHCSLTLMIRLEESRIVRPRLLDTCAFRVSSRSFALLPSIYSESAVSKVIFFIPVPDATLRRRPRRDNSSAQWAPSQAVNTCAPQLGYKEKAARCSIPRHIRPHVPRELSRYLAAGEPARRTHQPAKASVPYAFPYHERSTLQSPIIGYLKRRQRPLEFLSAHRHCRAALHEPRRNRPDANSPIRCDASKPRWK